MQAIHTKFIPATSYKPARIKAYTHTPDGMEKFSVTISRDGPVSRSDVQRHFDAAKAFADKYFIYGKPLDENCVYGSSADGKGYCFCFPESTVKSMG